MTSLHDDHRVQEPSLTSYSSAVGQLPLLEWYRPTNSQTKVQPGEQHGKEVEVVFRELVPYIPSTTYGTFGLYRYPAKFIPQVVAYVIEHYGVRGHTVFDPFAGCGTSGLTARLFGLNYELWDLNPLLGILHEIAITKPTPVDVPQLAQKMLNSEIEWLPDWNNLAYWFPQEVIPFLSHLWGYYHSCSDETIKKLITVPLLKLTRMFSYNDAQRQKLSRSPKAMARIIDLLRGDWKSQADSSCFRNFFATLSC